MKQLTALKILKSGHNVLLTGPAGTGKTYLLNKFIRHLKNKDINVAITASTGIASTHLNGRTIHSWAGFGIKDKLTESDLYKIKNYVVLATRIKSVSVLIIDEISMLHGYQLDMLNKICRFVRESEKPFGGIQIVLCGDFFQLPPVSKQKQQGRFITESKVWQNLNVKICYLTEQYRHQDNKLSNLLIKIRNGHIDEDLINELAKRLNIEFNNLQIATKLHTHNINVDAINNTKLEKLSGKKYKYLMNSSGNKKLIKTLKKNCLAPECLELKLNAIVMFVKNNFGKGYVNGTIGKIVSFDKDQNPIIKTNSGKKITALTTSWTIEDNEVVIAKITQIPLRLAWAITIHKSQGMTLDNAEIDLSKAFTFGLGYVALSRIRNLNNLKLLGLNEMSLMVSNKAKDIDKKLIKISKLAENGEYVEKDYKKSKKSVSELIWEKITNALLHK